MSCNIYSSLKWSFCLLVGRQYGVDDVLRRFAVAAVLSCSFSFLDWSVDQLLWFRVLFGFWFHRFSSSRWWCFSNAKTQHNSTAFACNLQHVAVSQHRRAQTSNKIHRQNKNKNNRTNIQRPCCNYDNMRVLVVTCFCRKYIYNAVYWALTEQNELSRNMTVMR